jgi:hypothetical protein
MADYATEAVRTPLDSEPAILEACARSLGEIRAVLLTFTDADNPALWNRIDGSPTHFGHGLLIDAENLIHEAYNRLDREWDWATSGTAGDYLRATLALGWTIHTALVQVNESHTGKLGPLSQASYWLTLVTGLVAFHAQSAPAAEVVR